MHKIIFCIFLSILTLCHSFGNNKDSDTSIAVDSFNVSDKKYDRFMLMTKECKHCQNIFKIEILINNTPYLNTVAKDYLLIEIPTALPDDVIYHKKI